MVLWASESGSDTNNTDQHFLQTLTDTLQDVNRGIHGCVNTLMCTMTEEPFFQGSFNNTGLYSKMQAVVPSCYTQKTINYAEVQRMSGVSQPEEAG